MGIPILITGPSGFGKSTGLMNMPAGEVGVINVSGKPLPFRGGTQFAHIEDARRITKAIKSPKRRCYVIDDAQYIMGFAEMDSELGGYDKWNAIGYDFVGLVRSVSKLPADTTVYFLMHSEIGDDGRVKAKTLGKLIDNHYTLEGLFPVVLLACCDGTGYWYQTTNDGTTNVKAPIGMFEDDRIPNDIKLVDDAVRDYWGLKPRKEEEE